MSFPGLWLSRRTLFAALLAPALLPQTAAAETAADPLPSWNDGNAKQSIRRFVERVTASGGADFVPPEQRIATFDNDGTLWCEQPFYFQLAFAFDEVKRLAPKHPDWKSQPPFKAVLEKNPTALAQTGEKGLLEIVMATHSGMTVGDFEATVVNWTKTAQHPRFKRPYTDIVYQPMQELLTYLRGNGFKTFIVSGGGVEFMRPWTEKVYGIPPEQVVGSSGVTTFAVGNDGKPVLMKQAKVEFVDDGSGKPVGINRFIGRRPIFAFGNSDGDLAMLQWTAAGGGPRFMGLVHHTDAQREYAYDRDSRIGKLDVALDEGHAKGWTFADMKKDWRKIFAFEAS